MQTSSSPSRWPWIMLPARLVLFAAIQALFALGFYLGGSSSAWDAGAAWWPFAVGLTNLVCLFLLVRLFKQEGGRYWDIFRFDRQHIKGDLLVLLASLVVMGPVSMGPNSLLASALFGDAMAPMRQFLAPLPLWAVYSGGLLLFPITQGLVELATYFAYVMPRLGKLSGRPWLAYVLASTFLGLQHAAMPLRFDWRFLLWRGVMFMPFAFLIGAILKWRPRLLPYLAIVHVLMDFSTGILYVTGF
jgi:hypothetical protein